MPVLKQARQGSHRDWKNLENENGHGKVMEQEKLAKSHGILWNFTNFAPELYQICIFWSPLRN